MAGSNPQETEVQAAPLEAPKSDKLQPLANRGEPCDSNGGFTDAMLEAVMPEQLDGSGLSGVASAKTNSCWAALSTSLLRIGGEYACLAKTTYSKKILITVTGDLDVTHEVTPAAECGFRDSDSRRFPPEPR